MKQVAGFVLAVAAVCGASIEPHAAATGGRAVARCPASFVHYERFRGQGPVKTLPWVAAEPRSVGLVGHLFYYGRSPWGKRHLPGWRIYTGGKSPDKRINMKVLWTAPPRISDAGKLVVRGTRIGRPARFSQVLDVGPSILRIPRAGCWRLSLTAGAIVTRLAVVAVSS